MKTTAKKSAARKIEKHATAPVRSPKIHEEDRKELMKYLVPGALLLGGGLLTTAGILMKKQLVAVLRGAAQTTLSQGAAVLDELDYAKLLSHVGLQRKKTGAFLVPGIGVAAGVAVGAALTYWLSPLIVPGPRWSAEAHALSADVVSPGANGAGEIPPTTKTTDHHATS